MTPSPKPDRTSLLIRWVGIAIAIYETVGEQTDRPYLLGLAASMMVGSLALDRYRSGK